MARVDDYAIEEQIQTILQADATLAGVMVTVEEELIFGAESTPWVGIYLDRYDAPSDLQRLAAGQQTTYIYSFSIWCWEYSLESMKKVIQLKSDLRGKVRVALMKNRTLGGQVSKAWLEGGAIESSRDPGANAWLSGTEIILKAEVTETTV